MTHCLLLPLLFSWVCKRKFLGGKTDVESDKLMLRVSPTADKFRRFICLWKNFAWDNFSKP